MALVDGICEIGMRINMNTFLTSEPISSFVVKGDSSSSLFRGITNMSKLAETYYINETVYMQLFFTVVLIYLVVFQYKFEDFAESKYDCSHLQHENLDNFHHISLLICDKLPASFITSS